MSQYTLIHPIVIHSSKQTTTHLNALNLNTVFCIWKYRNMFCEREIFISKGNSTSKHNVDYKHNGGL